MRQGDEESNAVRRPPIQEAPLAFQSLAILCAFCVRYVLFYCRFGYDSKDLIVGSSPTYGTPVPALHGEG